MGQVLAPLAHRRIAQRALGLPWKPTATPTLMGLSCLAVLFSSTLGAVVDEINTSALEGKAALWIAPRLE